VIEDIPGFVINDGVPAIVNGVLELGAGPGLPAPPPPT
jgi:hypothetical protein